MYIYIIKIYILSKKQSYLIRINLSNNWPTYRWLIHIKVSNSMSKDTSLQKDIDTRNPKLYYFLLLWVKLFDKILRNIYIYIWIFEVKLTFGMLTVRGQQHSFSPQERMFLWKCQSVWDRRCLDLRRTLYSIYVYNIKSIMPWSSSKMHFIINILGYGSQRAPNTERLHIGACYS